MLRLSLIVGLTLGFAPGLVLAQTVQLPSYHYFSVETSVLVPDRGTVSLGGVNRSATGSNRFGAPGLRGNRSSGAATQAGGVSVSAQIHDLEAMDQMLLEQAAALRQSRGDGFDFGRRASDPTPPSTSERTDPKQTKADDAKTLFAQAEEAQRAGKLGAARVYYQMAARRSSGPLHERALAKYHALTTATQAASRK